MIVVVFFCGLFLKPQDYLTLDLSHLSLAGQQRQHVWNVVETDTDNPPRSLIPRFLADGRPAELFLDGFFYTPPPLVFSKECEGWNFGKNSSKMLDDIHEGFYEKTMQKNKTQGELMLHEVFDLPKF